MLKKMAWNMFKNTGNINTMMELLEVKHLEDNLEKNANTNANNIDMISKKQENFIKDDTENNIKT